MRLATAPLARLGAGFNATALHCLSLMARNLLGDSLKDGCWAALTGLFSCTCTSQGSVRMCWFAARVCNCQRVHLHCERIQVQDAINALQGRAL